MRTPKSTLDLPKVLRHAYVLQTMKEAYKCKSADKARKRQALVSWHERNGYDEAAGSLREGMEETLTVVKLALPELLRKPGPAIENLNGTILQTSKRQAVEERLAMDRSRRRHARKSFQRLSVVHALRSKQKSLAAMMPKSIHRCRRYPTKFNSGRDIPDAQTPLEKVLQHRGAHARVFRRTQPYAQGHLRPIYCDTESYDDGLSGHLKAIHHQCRKLKRLQPPRQVFLELLRRLAHEVTAGGTLARATRLQLGRGFVQTRFVISGRYPHQDLIQHSLWKRVFFAEGFEVWKRRLLARLRTNSRSRHLDSTTTEAQLSVRAPPVVMSSPLLVLALGPGDLLGVLFQE